MSGKKASRLVKVPRRFRGGLDSGAAAAAAAERLPCDEEQPPSRRADAQGRAGRGHGDAGDSGGSIRERSRSPHGLRIKVEPDDDVPQPVTFNPRRTPGVQPPLNVEDPPPGELFSRFFDAAVLQLLCENTNKNAAAEQGKKRRFTWTEINPEELKTFIGMLLYMSVLRLPKMSDFWRGESIFHVSFPATIMSQDRFFAILSNLHMSDPEKDEINEEKRGTEDYDHLHWVRPLTEMMCMRCKAIYHPRQHLSVDDRMAASKAGLSIKQYIKAKPTKWWLKFFVLADINGYAIDFQLYTGKSRLASGNGPSLDYVTDLVKKDFLGSGYVIYTNNYTSPLLFQHLSQEGFGACGTYRQERVGVPTKHENALTTRSPQGSIQWIREGDLLWLDTREVSLCSTVHPVYNGDAVQHWETKDDEEEQKISVPRPTTVTEYNKYTGGVDTSDEMTGTSSVHGETRTWPITVFQHLVDIAVTNSFVIHKDQRASMQQTPMTRQCFEEELAAHLLGVSLKNEPQKRPGHKHLPVPTSSGQPKAQRASMGRRRCRLCHRSTAWMCETCDVGLCLQPDRNCYWQYHQD